MKFSQIIIVVAALLFSQLSFAQRRISSIRSIDFTNFTYPSKGANLPYSSKIARGTVYRLRKGEIPPKFGKRMSVLNVALEFNEVIYGDLTGDGIEEAIVSLSWLTGGNSMPDLIYIYTLRKGRPKLLWAFETGDRAYGGLKKVYAENGSLVVELYGKDKVIGKDLLADDRTNNGACCPTLFTRTRYMWRSGHFVRKDKSEVIPLER